MNRRTFIAGSGAVAALAPIPSIAKGNDLQRVEINGRPYDVDPEFAWDLFSSLLEYHDYMWTSGIVNDPRWTERPFLDFGCEGQLDDGTPCTTVVIL